LSAATLFFAAESEILIPEFMKYIVLFLTSIGSAFVCETAHAQWQTSIAAGVSQVSTIETDQNGRQLVDEHGLLPGVELHETYGRKNWRVGLVGEVYGGNITYNGQTQNGMGFSTDTKTRLYRIRTEAEYNLTEATLLVGGIEWEYWQRDILGQGATLGLNEQYQTWRLLVGAQTRILQTSFADLNLKALLVESSPEHLNVNFGNQLYDEAELTTKPATGVRMTLGVQPKAFPHIGIETEFEWTHIDRSDNAILRKNGVPVGTVAQPDHVRKALSVKVNYRF
jgi:hypothetical protein